MFFFSRKIKSHESYTGYRGPGKGLRDADIGPSQWWDYGVSHVFSAGLRDMILKAGCDISEMDSLSDNW